MPPERLRKLEQHQLPAVFELDAEPVPTNLRWIELLGKPFVVHPGGSGHGISRALQLNASHASRRGNET